MESQSFARQCHEDGSITITCGSSLTIQEAAGFSASVAEALATSSKVVLDIEAEVNADITALQVICAACKTAAAAGQTLIPQGPGVSGLRQLILAAGAERHGACLHNNDNQCLWFGGND